MRPPSSTLFPYTTLFRSRPATFGQEISLFGAEQPPRLPGAARPGRAPRTGSPQQWKLGSVGRTNDEGDRENTRRSEEHTSELQSPYDLVCRLLLEKKKKT